MNPEITDTDSPDTATATTDDEGNEGFLEGFKDQSTPTARPPDSGAQPAEQQPEFVQLTRQEVEELKARAALVQEIKATQDKSFGTLGGTIRSIRQDLDALRQGKKVEIDQADIDALREDFPPLAAALEKVRDLQVVTAGGLDADAISKMVEDKAAAKVTEYRQGLESRLLRRVHPDWEQYQESPEFSAWVGSQPAEFQQQLAKASEDWNSDFIADAMTAAKKAAQATSRARDDDASTRRSRMSAAVTPRGSGSTAGPNDDDAFHAGFKSG
jgi:hypothetical protein